MGSGAKPQPTSILVYSEREKTHLTATVIRILYTESRQTFNKISPKIVLGAFVANGSLNRDRCHRLSTTKTTTIITIATAAAVKCFV